MAGSVEPIVSPRKAELLGSTFRRFVRRGARGSISKFLLKMRPEDVASELYGLTPAEQAAVFRILLDEYREVSSEVLTDLESNLRAGVLEELSSAEITALLEGMPVDDTVELVESLPESVQEKVLAAVDLGDLEDVQEHLTYEDDSAGRVMDTQFFAMLDTSTVGEAIARIQDSKPENVQYLYIVDSEGRLSGVTSLRQLLLSDPGLELSGIMARNPIRADTETDQEEVARLASRYDLLAIPVVDDMGRLVGIVTVDDIIDIVREEATEDFLKMVGTSEDEIVYQDRSLRVFSIRFPWLLINLIGLVIAGWLIDWFEIRMEEALFLFPFVPVIMGMGGNIGSQTSTIAVRGLATGRISLQSGRVRSFLWQQAKVGSIIALACAAITAGGAYFLPLWGVMRLGSGNVNLVNYAAVVGVSLFFAVLLASVNGAMVPMVFERLGIDPAVASGPLVTTSNDITGIIIYFGLAAWLIEHLLR
jgi:magnesium transporter